MLTDMMFVKYVGTDGSMTLENPMDGTGPLLQVGDGKPFPVPTGMRNWFSTLDDFKIIDINLDDLREAVLKVLESKSNTIDKILPGAFRKRILFIAPDEGGYTGARYHAYQIALVLAKLQCHVNYVSSERPIFMTDFDSPQGVTFEYTDDLSTQFSGYDLVIGCPPQGIGPALDYSKKFNIPFWAICFEPDAVFIEAVPEYKEVGNNRYQLDVYSQADKVIVNSKLTKKQVIEHWHIPHNKIHIVPPAINFKEMHSAEALHNGHNIIYIGRAAAFKGVYELINLVLSNSDDLPAFKTFIISRDTEKIRGLKGVGNVKHPIIYLENISDHDKFRYIKGATVGVQLSKHEGFGMVPAEFLACGRPIICKPIEQIKNEYGDKVIYADSDDDVINHIVGLIEKASAVPKEVSEEIEKQYSLEEMQRRLDIILQHDIMKDVPQYSMKPKLLIALLYDYDPPYGGAERTFREHIKVLTDVGFECHVIITRNHQAKWFTKFETFYDGLAYVYRMPHDMFLSGAMDSFDAVKDLAYKIKPTAVVSYSEYTPVMHKVSKELNIPHIVSVNFWRNLTNNFVDPMDTSGATVHERGSEALKEADHIIANSTYTADVVKHITGRDAKVLFPYIAPEKVMAKDRNPRNILIGTLENGDARTLVADLARHYINENFVIGKMRGVDPGDEYLLKLPNVTHHDGEKDMRELYAEAKLVLVPSPIAHSFCRVGLEAMMNGIPVIASDRGNLPRLLENAGIICKDEECSTWVKAINAVLGDKSLMVRLSERGKDDAEKYSYDVYRAGLLSIFNKLLERTSDSIHLYCGDYPGVKTAMHHLERVVDKLELVSDIPAGAKHVVLGGWNDNYKTVKVDYLEDQFHSSIAQTDLSREGGLLLDVLKLVSLNEIDRLHFADKNTAKAFNKLFGAKIKWCPDCYDINEVINIKRGKMPGFNVSMFFPGHWRKNILTQMLAAKLAGAKVHTNNMVMNAESYAAFAKIIELDCETHNIPDRIKYLEFMATMDCALQVTWTESFNYAALEHMALGIPVLAPAFTPCMEFKSKKLKSWLHVDNPGDPNEIADKLMKIKEGFPEELRELLVKHVKRLSNSHAKVAVKLFGG